MLHGETVLQRQRFPVQLEQRVVGRGRRQRLLRHRPHDERVHRRDRPALGVGEHDGQGVLGVGRRELDPNRGGSDREQRHPGPGERDAATGVLSPVSQDPRVQAGVEQRRMQAEAFRIARGLLGQGHGGEHVVASDPHLLQALELRPVHEARVRQAFVQAREVDFPRAGRRPRRQVGGRVRVARRHHARGVARPHAVAGGSVEPRVHRDFAVALVLRRTDHDLELDTLRLRQHQWGVQGEFLDVSAADPVARRDGQLDQRGPRHQSPAEDLVLGHPRVGAGRQPARQHDAVARGQLDRGAEQRVRLGGQAEQSGFGGDLVSGRVQPVATALERVGGQVHALSAGPVEVHRPVDVGAGHGQLREGRHRAGDFRSAATEHRHEQRIGLGQASLGHRREDSVRPELQERGDTLGRHRAHAVGEAHRPADVRDPVGRRRQVGGDPAGHVRHDRDLRLVEVQAAQHVGELAEHRLHQR